MKVVLYSPYIPEHLGGGEAYLMRVAAELSQEHQVVVACGSAPVNSAQLRQRYQDFTDFNLQNVEFISSPLRSGSTLQKILWTRQFDVMYYQTDGGVFISGAKRNILHIQVPFTNQLSIATRFKLQFWPIRNTNSEFTKQVIEKYWHISVPYVHQPAIDMPIFSHHSGKKRPVIVHVGRFFRQLHSKRQDVLVEMFKQLCEQNGRVKHNWQLHLIGPVEDAAYAKEVAEAAQGWPIHIHHHLSRTALIKAYQEASIYWHATGVGVDAERYPEKLEHFGISTVEAMAAGCVPIVYAQGGQPEVLGPDLGKWGWQTTSEAIQKTNLIINDERLRATVGKSAKMRANEFDGTRFSAVLKEMIHA